MPVVLLGGPLFVARAAAIALGRVSPEVRAVTPEQKDAEALRALGVKVAVGEPGDADVLDPALSGAHTACLLGPDLVSSGDDTREHLMSETERVVERARATRIGRLVVVELAVPHAVPADIEGAVAARRTLVEESGIPYVVVQTSFVYGPGSEALRLLRELAVARPFARMVGPGPQRWAPVFVEDLALVLAGADDRAEVASGTRGLDGPDVVAMRDLVDLLAGRHRTARSVKSGRGGLVSENGRGLRNETLEWLSGDLIAGPPSAAEEFGVTLTPLREGLARSLD